MNGFAIALFIFLSFIVNIFTANYIHPVNEEDYTILNDLSMATFTKSKIKKIVQEKAKAPL